MSEQEFNKLFSDNLLYYLELNNKSQADLAKYVGVSTAAVNQWCKGLKTPRMDKVDKICQFFVIRRSDLLEERNNKRPAAYYLDNETADAAQFLFDNPEYKVLFDASRKVKPEDINFVAEMIKRITDK